MKVRRRRGCAAIVGFVGGVAIPCSVVAEHVEPTYSIHVCAAHKGECEVSGITAVQADGLLVGLHRSTRWVRPKVEH